MEACPIPVQNVTHTISTVLQGTSPMDGIRTRAQGNMQLNKVNGGTITTFSVDVTLV